MKKFIPAIFLLFCFQPSFSQDTLSFMYYNILNYSPTVPANAKDLRGIVQSINPDIFVTDEISDEASATQILASVLNVNAQHNYKRAVFIDGPDKDNMLFYNADKISLYSQDTIQTDLRLINEYRCYYNNATYLSQHDTVFFYVYAAHLKASQGYESNRYQEVLRFKSHLNEIPGRKNIFFGGDFNFYTSAEPAFTELTASGDYQFFDPIDSIGNWHDNAAFSPVHTQSTRMRQFGGGATGGLDDRFDFIMTTKDLIDGSHAMRYIPGTYRAYGNDGNHLNDSLTMLPLDPSIPDSVTYHLYNLSDHLPVLMKTFVNFNAAVPGHENSFAYTLHVYPNPAENLLCYKLPAASGNVLLKLYNYMGQVVSIIHPDISSGNEQKIMLDNSLGNGVYILELVTSSGVWSSRFVLHRK